MGKEAIAECLASLRDDIERVKGMRNSDYGRDLRLDNIEAALCVLMEALLQERAVASQ